MTAATIATIRLRPIRLRFGLAALACLAIYFFRGGAAGQMKVVNWTAIGLAISVVAIESGYLIAYEYTRWWKESQALRQAAVIGDWSWLNKTRVRGRDASRLMNYATVKNLSKQEIGQIVYTPMVNEAGKVAIEGLTLKLGEDEYLFTQSAGLKWLEFVRDNYAQYPGELLPFEWPVTKGQVHQWLTDFLQDRHAVLVYFVQIVAKHLDDDLAVNLRNALQHIVADRLRE